MVLLNTPPLVTVARVSLSSVAPKGVAAYVVRSLLRLHVMTWHRFCTRQIDLRPNAAVYSHCEGGGWRCNQFHTRVFNVGAVCGLKGSRLCVAGSASPALRIN